MPNPIEPDQVLTKKELEIIEIAHSLQEYVLDQYGEYPADIILASFMYCVSDLSEGKIAMNINKGESNVN